MSVVLPGVEGHDSRLQLTAVHLVRACAVPVPDALRRDTMEFPWGLLLLWTGMIGVAALACW
nr:hypothetical protein OH837_39645 [Streptomyces canus]